MKVAVFAQDQTNFFSDKLTTLGWNVKYKNENFYEGMEEVIVRVEDDIIIVITEDAIKAQTFEDEEDGEVFTPSISDVLTSDEILNYLNTGENVSIAYICKDTEEYGLFKTELPTIINNMSNYKIILCRSYNSPSIIDYLLDRITEEEYQETISKSYKVSNIIERADELLNSLKEEPLTEEEKIEEPVIEEESKPTEEVQVVTEEPIVEEHQVIEEPIIETIEESHIISESGVLKIEDIPDIDITENIGKKEDLEEIENKVTEDIGTVIEIKNQTEANEEVIINTKEDNNIVEEEEEEEKEVLIEPAFNGTNNIQEPLSQQIIEPQSQKINNVQHSHYSGITTPRVPPVKEKPKKQIKIKKQRKDKRSSNKEIYTETIRLNKKTILVTGDRGTGVTTITANIANTLNKENLKCGVIDLDFRKKNLSLFYNGINNLSDDEKYRNSLANVILEDLNIEESLVYNNETLSYLGLSIASEHTDITKKSNVSIEDKLIEIIIEYSNLVDVLIIDCPMKYLLMYKKLMMVVNKIVHVVDSNLIGVINAASTLEKYNFKDDSDAVGDKGLNRYLNKTVFLFNKYTTPIYYNGKEIKENELGYIISMLLDYNITNKEIGRLPYFNEANPFINNNSLITDLPVINNIFRGVILNLSREVN